MINNCTSMETTKLTNYFSMYLITFKLKCMIILNALSEIFNFLSLICY